MTDIQVPPRHQFRHAAVVAALLGLSLAPVEGATFTWKTGVTTGSWSTSTSWNPAGAPTGTNPSDILIFGGDTGTTYVSTDDIAGPFLLNQLVLTATDTTNKQNSHTLTFSGTGNPSGSILSFSGTAPKILQNGLGNMTIQLPITSSSDLIFGGTGQSNATFTNSVVTLNGGISGVFNITKEGGNTFRFGSAGSTPTSTGDFFPSSNRWVGALTINDGAIRFNNNAYTAPTALRSNPVTLNGDAVLSTQFKKNLTPNATSTTPNADPDSSLRFGTLNGTQGTLVLARREDATATNIFDSVDIVLTTLGNGTFAGTLRNKANAAASEVADSDSGKLAVRGIGQQTFSGTLDLAGDVEVGRGATLTLSGTASLGAQATGAIVLKGGTFRLDNTATNNSNRLRDASGSSTGLESIGGGTFSLIGNAAGTVETLGRLQLGNDTNARSGALKINVTTQPNSTSATELRFQSLSRDSLGAQFSTLQFSATDTSGTVLDLGQAGNNPRISFISGLGLGNGGLLKNTGNAATADSIGWATVSRATTGGLLDMDFATSGTNGIAAVTTQLGFAGAGINTNVRITGSTSVDTTALASIASLKLAPTAAGQALTLTGAGQLNTNAILLAGSTDFTISGPAGISGTGPRYFHVQDATLTLNAPVSGAAQPLVKAGAGTLVLSDATNSTSAQPTIINEGVLRATPGSSLPNGEVRMRGGVLELQGNGTTVTEFTRQIGFGANKITWSGLNSSNVTIGQDRGSGGFAAIGSDANVTITSISGGTTPAWEEAGFVDSGHALVFGSRSADHVVNWTNNLKLSSNDPIYPAPGPNGIYDTKAANYNAREIRVLDNTSVTTDRARISGVVSGTGLDDLMKTGTGVLELSGTNSYQGGTLVQEGTLVVNGSIAASFLTNIADGATLAGRGTVGSVYVASGGTLAPGELAGFTGQMDDLAINAGLKFGGTGAKLKFELGVGGYDQLNVKGSVTLDSAELVGSLLDGFLGNPGDLFFLIINDGTDAVQGTFAQGSLISFGGQNFEISYFGDSDTQQFTGGNDVVLRVVPEPSTALLLGSGLALLGARRRKR